MIGIGGLGYLVPAGRAAPAAKNGAAGFWVGTGRAGSAMPSAAVAMPGLLGLQESESAAVGDREARRHAEDMLEMLREMQRELLGGSAPSALKRAAELAERNPQASDPALRDLQQAVLLRVAVERTRYLCDIGETGR